jgi:hypothetical protein
MDSVRPMNRRGLGSNRPRPPFCSKFIKHRPIYVLFWQLTHFTDKTSWFLASTNIAGELFSTCTTKYRCCLSQKCPVFLNEISRS